MYQCYSFCLMKILKMLTPVLQTMISIFLIKQIDYFLQLLKNAVASKTPAAAVSYLLSITGLHPSQQELL